MEDGSAILYTVHKLHIIIKFIPTKYAVFRSTSGMRHIYVLIIRIICK